jgi:hypothetical protein
VFRTQDLDRDDAIECHILRPVDVSHTSLALKRGEAIASA